MREHLYIVRFRISKTFLGKIITSVGCLHSFQGLFYYIVLTLKGYFRRVASQFFLVSPDSQVAEALANQLACLRRVEVLNEK